MPIFFLMRQDVNTSFTLKALNNIIRADGNELILSTGYVNIDLLTNPNNNFINSFTEWFDKADANNNLKLTLVGGMIKHRTPYNLNNYRDYFVCNSISNNGCDQCVINTNYGPCKQYSFKKFIELVESWIPVNKKQYINIVFAIATNYQYHAKVALKYMDNEPVMALCGSSNLTKAALEEGYPNFNCEADMLVYINQKQFLKFILDRKKYLDNQDIREDVRELIAELYSNIRNISEILSSLPDEEANENREWHKLLYNFLNSEEGYNLLLNNRNLSKINGFLDEAVSIKKRIELVEAQSKSNIEIIQYSARKEVCEKVLMKISNIMQSYILLKTKTIIKNSSSEYSNNWYK